MTEDGDGTAAAATADEMDGVEKAKGAEDEFADLWRLFRSPTGPGDANFEPKFQLQLLMNVTVMMEKEGWTLADA